MPPARTPLWTTGRQLIGNVLPLLFMVPVGGMAVAGLLHHPLTPQAIAWSLAFPVVSWLSVNLLGLTGNQDLKQEMGKRLFQEKLYEPIEKMFVGFARPSHKGLLDPHEDVGYLLIYPDRLEFYGSAITVPMLRSSVSQIRFRANPHSLLFLGRWVSVEGTQGSQALRLLVEPREKMTLWGNRRLSAQLRKRLIEWKDAPSAAAPDSDPPAPE